MKPYETLVVVVVVVPSSQQTTPNAAIRPLRQRPADGPEAEAAAAGGLRGSTEQRLSKGRSDALCLGVFFFEWVLFEGVFFGG